MPAASCNFAAFADEQAGRAAVTYCYCPKSVVLWLENPIVAWLTSIDVLSPALHCQDLTPSGTGSKSGSSIVLVFVTQELRMPRGIYLNGEYCHFEADWRRQSPAA